VVTRKSGDCVFEASRTRELSAELSIFLSIKGNRLMLVHGGGSFGHPSARKYEINYGFKSQEQLPGFAEVRANMRELNARIISTLLSSHIMGVSVPPESVGRFSSGHFYSSDFDILEMALSRSLVPVLFGDAVFDRERYFSILSGDTLMLELSRHFNPDISVFCTDVDGVFTSNPKIDRDARLIPEVSGLAGISTTSSGKQDVTGEMAGKLSVLMEVARYSSRTMVLNGKKRGILSAALMGRKVRCTEIVVPR